MQYIACLSEGEHYTQIIHTRTIAVGLLHTPSGWVGLASSLGGELSSGSASSLLGTGHMVWCLCLTLLLCVWAVMMARIVCVEDFGGMDLSVDTTNSSVSDALQIQPNFGKQESRQRKESRDI